MIEVRSRFSLFFSAYSCDRNAFRRQTMIGATIASAAMNCHPISTIRMMLSSRTRLVDAISRAMAAVKFDAPDAAAAGPAGLNSESSSAFAENK
jgi:hypothetical protein